MEVLRISTVVDWYALVLTDQSFGSTKNFYCCRSMILLLLPRPLEVLRISTVVDIIPTTLRACPLEVLRISTVVDPPFPDVVDTPLEVLRISTVVDLFLATLFFFPLEVLRISTVVDQPPSDPEYYLWKY